MKIHFLITALLCLGLSSCIYEDKSDYDYRDYILGEYTGHIITNNQMIHPELWDTTDIIISLHKSNLEDSVVYFYTRGVNDPIPPVPPNTNFIFKYKDGEFTSTWNPIKSSMYINQNTLSFWHHPGQALIYYHGEGVKQ